MHQPDGLVLQHQRTQKKDFGNRGKRDDTWTDHRERNVTWDNISDKQEQGSLNDAFETYYKEQGICPEAEWTEFLQTLVKPLPIVFRINGSGKFADALRKRLEDDFFSKFTQEKLVIDGAAIFTLYIFATRQCLRTAGCVSIRSRCIHVSMCVCFDLYSDMAGPSALPSGTKACKTHIPCTCL